jgi:hypothetical protein
LLCFTIQGALGKIDLFAATGAAMGTIEFIGKDFFFFR